MARATKAVKAANHRKVVEGSSRQIRKQGLSGFNIAEAMQAAGLTHGGFYRHFQNKDQLLVEAVKAAFDEFNDSLRTAVEGKSPEEALNGFIDLYFSGQHAMTPEGGCPAAALGGEIRQASDQIRQAYDQALDQTIDLIDRLLAGCRQPTKISGTDLFAFMVGSLTLARAATDPEKRAERLASGRAFVLANVPLGGSGA